MFTEMMASGSGGGVNIQSGEKTYSNLSSATYYTDAITFDTPFATIPKVYVRAKFDSGDYGNSKYVTGVASEITTTGFTLSYIQGQTGTSGHTFTYEWIAFVD